jgi:uncharacterized membrane protein YkoI
MRIRLTTLLFLALAALPAARAEAFDLEQALRDLQPQASSVRAEEYRVADDKGETLSEAIESVRRKTDGRIVSAETKVSNGREMHHIKVLTKDGKVKTYKVQGRRRGEG